MSHGSELHRIWSQSTEFKSDTDSYETLHGLNFFIIKEIVMDKKYITVWLWVLYDIIHLNIWKET